MLSLGCRIEDAAVKQRHFELSVRDELAWLEHNCLKPPGAFGDGSKKIICNTSGRIQLVLIALE